MFQHHRALVADLRKQADMSEPTGTGLRIVGHAALAERLGWASPQAARSRTSNSKRRRQLGISTPADVPPPDGYAGQVPFWHEVTIAAWDAARSMTIARNRNKPDGMKVCSRCGKEKPVSEFPASTDWRRPHLGPQPMAKCKACRVQLAMEWNEDNPERKAAADAKHRKNTHRKRKARDYGLTEVELMALEAAQQGICAICGEFAESGLRIDHDHKTGLVRGLLCNGCNLGLGAFRDDPKRLMRAIRYLMERSNGVFAEPDRAGAGRVA